MGPTRSHPLPPGIFVEMPSPPLARSDPPPEWYTNAETIDASNEFNGWTDEDIDALISRLQKRVRELESEKAQLKATCEYDSGVRKMVENGEHTCHMFDAECQACEDEEEVQNDPEMTAQVGKVDHLRAHFC